jgi:hypothetical protein
MTLTQIIQATADRMNNVSVDVRTNFGTVCIKDCDGIHEDIFLQGDDAVIFIMEAQANYNQCGDVTMSECYAHQAEQFVDNIWN